MLMWNILCIKPLKQKYHRQTETGSSHRVKQWSVLFDAIIQTIIPCRAVKSIVFYSQWFSQKTSPLCHPEEIKSYRFRMAIKWSQNFHFWMNCPFKFKTVSPKAVQSLRKSVLLKESLYVCLSYDTTPSEMSHKSRKLRKTQSNLITRILPIIL